MVVEGVTSAATDKVKKKTPAAMVKDDLDVPVDDAEESDRLSI